MSTSFRVASSAEVPSPAELLRQYLLWLQMRNCSPITLYAWQLRLEGFLAWCGERGITCVQEVTPAVLAAYRRWLYHYRNERTGKPLRFATQAAYLMPIRRWFAWLAATELLAHDPAAELELPKEEKRLPAAVLTAEEVERMLNTADISQPLGLRDRALLETLYSTALRVSELAALQVYDLQPDRRILAVRQGKGRKDRMVPIGRRALTWVDKYLADVRPRLVEQSGESALFVTSQGRPFHRTHLSALVRRAIKRAGIAKPGSCHLLRHTTTTLMLQEGADLRSLQLMLGHSKLTTTQIYTHVSIERLRQVHDRTHPARPDGQRPTAPDAAADGAVEEDR